MSEIMINGPGQVFVERRGRVELSRARLQMITDIAALARMGTTSTNQTVAAQQTGIDNTIRTVFNVNYGGAPDRPSFSTTVAGPPHRRIFSNCAMNALGPPGT